jgi:hypothetical protein
MSLRDKVSDLIRNNARHVLVPFLLWLALVLVVAWGLWWLYPRISCASSGGRWVRDGIFGQAQYCRHNYSDAGKACTRSADCEGGCMLDGPISLGDLAAATAPPLGYCQRDNGMFGCFTYIERPSEGICID